MGWLRGGEKKKPRNERDDRQVIAPVQALVSSLSFALDLRGDLQHPLCLSGSSLFTSYSGFYECKADQLISVHSPHLALLFLGLFQRENPYLSSA